LSETVHGTAVLAGAHGVLIRGPSGSGKSTLAAALIARGGRLVADDRVHLSACHGRIVATGPAAIVGKLELRGRGLVSVPHEQSAVIRLLVDIVPEGELERLPAEASLAGVLLGVSLARQPVTAAVERAVMLVDAALAEVAARREMGLRSASV
jgi:serine kinase of HPr protein (carbohydrate metabolism regulator)